MSLSCYFHLQLIKYTLWKQQRTLTFYVYNNFTQDWDNDNIQHKKQLPIINKMRDKLNMSLCINSDFFYENCDFKCKRNCNFF